MELRHLRNFLTVVEQKSISKAACVVRLAQPALSRQLQALEAELGRPLLYRHGWGITPTAEGEVLARHARSLLDQAQAVRDAVGAVSGSSAGRIAVGVPSSMAATLLPEFAMAARRSLPRVQLRLVEAYSGTLRSALLAGELDAALIYPERRHSTLITRPLLREALVAIGPPGAFGAETAISIPELVTRDLIMPAAANRLRMLVENAAIASGVTVNTSLEIDSVPALIELVAAGAGLTVLPYSTVHEAVEKGQVSYARIAPEQMERRLVLARTSERMETPLWRAVADLLEGILRSREQTHRWTVENAA